MAGMREKLKALLKLQTVDEKIKEPFAGIGADAFAMDYNPVAALLEKVALEYLTTYGVERLG